MKVLALTNAKELKEKLPLVFFNCGVKGLKKMPKADLYLDCRGLANPSIAGLGGGDDPTVQEWVLANSDISPYIMLIEDALSRMTTRRGPGHEYDKPFRILTMCAHGIHRSRAAKHILAKWAKSNGYKSVEVE